LQAARAWTDDAAVHPAVAALPLEEKGFVLATMLARTPADEARSRLGGEAGARCAAAVATLAGAPRAERASALAALIALVRAPVPAGLERIHPGWLRERFERESSAVIRAVVPGLPPEVTRVAEQVLEARGEAAGTPERRATAEPQLQRIVFAALVPMTGPGAASGARARELLALGPEHLVAAIERAGAATLGASLRGSDGATVARAAAALGETLAAVVVEAAARQTTEATRARARDIVASVGRPAASEAAWELGARAVAAELDGDTAAIAAVAQRLPPERGRRLLQAAGL
jgi:hypothetical protein